ncbi:hypothetical protein Scep_001097 [Stephania cephalantha]|uniref:Suppressor of RPS4-RLD 1 n=1 Tax=Stephania cephalantha TaxID=152367 RepID=A0AAP0L7I6_9MAGN
MVSAVSERAELAKLCSSRQWSKAIRLLDSLLARSLAIQDICNRAFCYSQLELHKHVIKDCDKAIELDRTRLQAYILKGKALSALGKKDEAITVWKQGYGCAISQSADLGLLLEVEELLACAKQSTSNASESHETESFSSSSVFQCQSKSNGIIEISSKPSDNLKVCTKSNGISKSAWSSCDTSEVSSNSSVTLKICRSDASDVHYKPNGTSIIIEEPNDKSEIQNKTNGDANKSIKVSAKGGQRTTSISLDFRLPRGIAQVNEGKYDQAISLFNQILKENPTYPEALIGRGTALAFQRELNAAITDFTEAIKSNPSAGEAWKRRGQARAALGEYSKAIDDLSKALEFEPNSSDVLHERGIVNFKFKDYNAAVEDLSLCVMVDKTNKSAYTYLGLSLSSIGEYERAKEAHMKSIQIDRCFLDGWIHLAQFYQDLANPAKALECLEHALQVDERFAKAFHLRGLLCHGMGEHRKAIKDLSTGLSIESSNIECLYLRASCYHAVGEYGEAVKDYDAVLELEIDSMEKFVLQCLAFYQKEIALYTASKVNSEFCWFDIDEDINPLFKEYWCKRAHPKDVCEKVFRQPPLRDSLKKGRLRKQDFIVTKQKATLIQAADFLGKKIQYTCPGFLPNRRQHRMAGLAAIEIAQKVVKAWRSLQGEWKHSSRNSSKNGKKARRKEKTHALSHNRGGAGCSTSSSSETSSYSIAEDKSPGNNMMSWKEVYSIAVKWRQISEPCDPVVWINKLSEEFNSGFGSHTPLIVGQAKVVRYFPNYQRVLTVAKRVMNETMYVYNAKDTIIDISEDGKLQDVLQAESCSDLYNAIGDTFWLATWCNSVAFEGKRIEGTRITLLKKAEQSKAFDFAIRTPCTPSRWDDYDTEMAMAWEAVCNAYCGEAYGSTDPGMLENVQDAILRMTYYWYNFMPLSRGSAAVGYVVLLGLFLAANMEVMASIPPGFQVDWEAILTSDPISFAETIKQWMCPSLKISNAWKDYPEVASTLPTTGSVVAALSYYDD